MHGCEGTGAPGGNNDPVVCAQQAAEEGARPERELHPGTDPAGRG